MRDVNFFQGQDMLQARNLFYLNYEGCKLCTTTKKNGARARFIWTMRDVNPVRRFFNHNILSSFYLNYEGCKLHNKWCQYIWRLHVFYLNYEGCKQRVDFPFFLATKSFIWTMRDVNSSRMFVMLNRLLFYLNYEGCKLRGFEVFNKIEVVFYLNYEGCKLSFESVF